MLRNTLTMDFMYNAEGIIPGLRSNNQRAHLNTDYSTYGRNCRFLDEICHKSSI